MTKRDFVKAVQGNLKNKEVKMSLADINEVIRSIKEEIFNAVSEGEAVKLQGLGVFGRKIVAEHECVNPQTGDKMTVPTRPTLAFKKSQAFVDKLRAEYK